ncbi:MAG: HD domain-containing protein [Rheinheimera sp.]|nr:HD domain-containing protein [Rheinheimera sp.]
MVTVRHSHSTVYNPGETMEWLCSLGLPEGKISCLMAAEQWLQSRALTELACPQVHTGWEMVEILADLRMDKDALTAALLFPLVEAQVLSCEDVQSEFPPAVVTMLAAVNQMEAIRTIPVGPNQNPNAQQADNLRKMLLTMVEDVRAVVIKLAAQICYLRDVKNADEETQNAGRQANQCDLWPFG